MNREFLFSEMFSEIFSDLIIILFFIVMMRNNMGTLYCMILLTASIINWYTRIVA